MSSTNFNPNFYAPQEKVIFERCQNTRGCFYCGSPNPTKKCSACRFAVYCNQDCQKAHWKKESKNGHLAHKDPCKDMIYLLRKADYARPMPLFLRRFGFNASDDAIEQEMQIYTGMFIEELTRAEVTNISLTVFCLGEDDVVRLYGGASFWGGEKLQAVNYVMFPEVDRGSAAVRNIETKGTISTKAKDRVLGHIDEFRKRLLQKGVSITGIAPGTGLQNLISP